MNKYFDFRYYSSRRHYSVIQFTDRRTGKLFNYCPDSSPYSYGDCVDMKAIFKIKLKYKTKTLWICVFGREFLFELKSKW